jgi:Uma2 family endonuclease
MGAGEAVRGLAGADVGYNVPMTVSSATYERVALEDSDHIWELDAGQLRRKPDMTQEHNDAATELALQIAAQLDTSRFTLRQNSGHLQAPGGRSYVPDVFVLPRDYRAPRSVSPGRLEAYDKPMPFVCEVWSRSTGDYDTDAKIPHYQARGDAEIWRIHPYASTVTAWRRQADGTYEETELSGSVSLAAFPEISIDIGRLFFA